MLLKQLSQRLRKLFAFHLASYRIPLSVTQIVLFPSGDSYCVCPRCDNLLDREYMSYCDCCGQCLSWNMLDHAHVLPWAKRRHPSP